MIPPETIARESPDEIGAAIASEWGEGVERMDQADIAKVAAEGARRARGEHIRESPEVKLETTSEERERWIRHDPDPILGGWLGRLCRDVDTLLETTVEERAQWRATNPEAWDSAAIRDVDRLLAEVARLKAELADATTSNGYETTYDERSKWLRWLADDDASPIHGFDLSRKDGAALIRDLHRALAQFHDELVSATTREATARAEERGAFENFVIEAAMPDETRRDLRKRIRARSAP